MERLVNFALKRRGLLAVIFLVVSLFGIYSWTRLSIDAYPDIADVTVQVVTQVPGLAAEEVEQQITIPLERALNGIPSLDIMRSKNAFGLSIIVLVFQDGTEDYWARQRVRECIGDVDLPYDAVPELNPLTSPTGEIYRYVLESLCCKCLEADVVPVEVAHYTDDTHVLVNLHRTELFQFVENGCEVCSVVDRHAYANLACCYHVDACLVALEYFEHLAQEAVSEEHAA